MHEHNSKHMHPDTDVQAIVLKLSTCSTSGKCVITTGLIEQKEKIRLIKTTFHIPWLTRII